MPAYAITVHKSQGSEYGVVIIPFVPRYGGMLQRNLLYTAVTRAKRKVIIVGTTSAVERAVRTVNADERYTLFKERLQGRCDSYFHLYALTVVHLWQHKGIGVKLVLQIYYIFVMYHINFYTM